MSWSLRIAGAAISLALLGAQAHAQGMPGQGGYASARSQTCAQLEGQLAEFDRSSAVPDGRTEQIRRYEEAASKQQAELDRMVAQTQRMGCEGRGFFLVGGGQSQQCDQTNAQIQRMRANLDRILTGLEQLQGGGSGRDERRRGILIALGQYDCGPQYRNAAAPPSAGPRGIFETLFGVPGGGGQADMGQAGTFRTLCVRTCDGFYFPISHAATAAKFREDERTCQRLCPAAEVALYSHRNPGEEAAQSVSISGRPYTELPNAFRYRQEVNTSCTCKRPGETWTEAIGNDDETIQRGDIVVTDDKSKALATPKVETPGKQARPEPPRGRGRNATPQSAEKPAESAPAAPPPQAQAAPPQTERPRAVGPQFYPVR